MADGGDHEQKRRELMGHPAGLFVLFMVELWERFSFYGMRALLTLYMTKQLLFSDEISYGIYAAYGALVYATPVIGGFLADRLLGYKKAITAGAILMAVGHFTMTFDAEVLSTVLAPFGATALEGNVLKIPGLVEFDATLFLYTALALLILGNGFFKPNISSLVGKLYDDDDVDESKRDGGFTIFYMGINIGAFLAGIVCGTVGETYGWHYGFGLAGFGMLAGLIIFWNFGYLVGDKGEAPDPDRLDAPFPFGVARERMLKWGAMLAAGGVVVYLVQASVLTVVGPWIGTLLDALSGLFGSGVSGGAVTAYLTGLTGLLALLAIQTGLFGILFTYLTNFQAVIVGTLIAVPNVAYMITRHEVMGGLLLLVGIGVFGWLISFAIHSDPVDRDRLIVVMVLIFFSMTFWAFFEQAGSSMNLFTDRNVDRLVWGWEVPTTWFQSANPLFIMLLAPVFAWLWQFLKAREWEPRTPTKFGLGLLQLSMGFGALVVGAQFAGPDGKVAMVFLLLAYMLHTTGELCLSPVGLSMVTKLSPKKAVGAVMGAWFLSTSFAHYIAGLFAQFASAPEGSKMGQLPVDQRLAIYTDLFGTIAIIALCVGLLCFALVPWLNKKMHGVH